MKKFIIAVFTISFLVACGNSDKALDIKDPLKNNDTEVIKLSDVQNIGFQTAKDGGKLEDKGPAIIKDVKCSKEKSPVCGKIGTMLNGYLNKCEAERHGAEIISEGLCKFETLKDEKKCHVEFLTIGNCEMFVSGFSFNRNTNTCEAVSGSGCNAQIAFESKENCEQSCLNE